MENKDLLEKYEYRLEMLQADIKRNEFTSINHETIVKATASCYKIFIEDLLK